MVCPVLPFTSRGSGNSHFLSELPKRELFLVTLDLDEVAKRLYACRQGFTLDTIG